MAERTWGLITSGATFEALVATLVFFEDPKAALFGRRGKDGGQDARSGDGKLVYQAKHHEDGAAAKAISDAKKEAAKIAEYRKPGHARYEQWKEATHWRLVTNATFNPTDHQTWTDDVVPLFAALGLEADYWERRTVDALLDKHPEVDRSFFGNEPRAFLTLQEVRERLVQEEPFVQRAPTSFVGRDVEIGRIADFIKSEQSFLVIHGAGGMGKSRLLVEAGAAAVGTGWQVLWANVATIASGVSWFDAIVPERPTVLLVDEPDDEDVLRLLAEQLGGRVGRAARWKVLVAVRSPKDPVLKFLSAPKLKTRVQWLPLEALPKDAAQQMCLELLASGPLATSPDDWKRDVSAKLADRFSRQPIWLTLAVHVLETHKDLNKVPTTAAALADTYLDEVISQQTGETPDRVLGLLRWIALVGTVNRENDAVVRLVSEGTGIGDPTTTLALITRLLERRALRQRGAHRRLVELKPDVLRDHLLRNWLVDDVGFGTQPLRPSAAALQLVTDCLQAISKGGLSPVGLAILTSVGRTELLFRLDNRPVPLLDPFFEGVRDQIQTLPASGRISLCETLVQVAPLRPRDVVSISRALRTSPVNTESIKSPFGTREVTNDAVLLGLGWPVYHAAMGAQDLDERVQVLEELYDLAEVEAEIGTRKGGLPNDGRRAGPLVGRTLEGGPNFWSDFDDAVGILALRKLDKLKTRAPTNAQTDSLRALVVPAVAVEREQTRFDDNTFTISRYIILPGHAGWETRKRILERIKSHLSDNSLSVESHVVLWGLLVEGHRHANFVALHGPEDFQKLMHIEFLTDLRWTEATLKSRGAQLEEMKAARDLWEWHTKHEKNEEIKAAANSLESLYNTDALAAEFEPLLAFDTVEEFERHVHEKASQLASSDGGAIDAFIERGERYVDEDRRLFALQGVASELGALAGTTPQVRDFLTKTLSTASSPLKINFALAATARWAHETRKQAGGSSTLDLIRALLAACTDDFTRIRLLMDVYGNNPPRLKCADLVPDEHVFLRSQSTLFRGQNKSAWFVGLVSWTLQHVWSEYKVLVESELKELAEPTLTDAVATLIQGVFWATYKRERSEFPPDVGRWLLDQVIRVADFDKLSSNLEYRLDEILKVVAPVPISWLPTALKERSAVEANEGYASAKALSHNIVLSDYVQPIEEAQKEDLEVAAAVSELLDLADDKGTVGYRLPDVLHNIDPNGLVVAPQSADRIRRGGVEVAQRLARIARAYVVNTPGWRTIALPVVELALALEPSERRPLFRALADAGVRSWSGTPGEVAPVFVHAVETARGYRDRETDSRLGSFWDWYLSVAEAELRRQEEDAREERGE